MCISSFGDLNWLSIIVAAIAAFAVGSLWYTPVLFGNLWAKLNGITKEEIDKSNMALIFGSAFLLEFIAAIGLDLVLGKDACLTSGLITGFFISVFWVATSFGVNYLFVRKPIKLFLIDAGYYIITFSLMGLILGAW